MIRLFNHYVPRGALVIAGAEALILAFSIYLAMLFWPGQGGPDDARALHLKIVELSAVMLAVMVLMGLYTRELVEGWRSAFLRLIAAFLLGAVVLALIASLGRLAHLAVYPVGAGIAVALLVISLERMAVFRWASPLSTRALVLGAGTRAAQVDALMPREGGAAGTRSSIIGYLPVNETNCHVPGDRILIRYKGESLWELADRYGVDEIIIGVRDRRNGRLPVQELLDCRLHGIRVTDLSSFFEREGGQVPLESLNSSWLIFGGGFRKGWLRESVKRTFDVIFSLVLLVVALPVMLLTALAILVTMGAPVLYWQERVGQDGRVFRICKFRSMRNDAEGDGKPRWAQQDDDRITPLGRIIRKLRIDELPQVYNVLKGEMSFVGPRPERPEFVRDLAHEIPFYEARHSVKPGITGWAQVRYPYGASLEDARGKLQYDIYYVKNRSLFLDITILMLTVEVVLWGRGSR